MVIEDSNIADTFLNELYDDMAGLTIDDPTRPLAAIAMHTNENPYTKTEWDTWVSDYKELHIQKYFNLNVDEFFNRGRWEASELLRMAKKFISDDSKKGDDIDNQLKKELQID